MRKTILVTVAAAAMLAACGKPKSEETPAAEPAPGPAAEAAESAPSAEEIVAEEAAAAAEPAFDASAAPAGVYQPDPKHRYIMFSYDHFGYSRPQIRWRNWTADLNWDPAAPDQSTISVVIDATQPDSGVDMFDGHLRSEGFFDAAQFPEIRFNSTSVAIDGPNSAIVTGDLTIKDVTKPVSLDVTINRAADDSMAKGHKLGFSASGVVKRTDFGLGQYAPMVGDDVAIAIEAEFLMPKEAEAGQ